MAKKPDFDTVAAHKYFSAHCFNAAWGLMDKKERTPEETEQMIELCQASLWHWSQREDGTDQNRSVGYWQASRVYALAGQTGSARRYGKLSLEAAADCPPFYRGYAYEGLARAEMVAGDKPKMKEYLSLAHEQAEAVKGLEEKKMLEADLEGIK